VDRLRHNLGLAAGNVIEVQELARLRTAATIQVLVSPVFVLSDYTDTARERQLLKLLVLPGRTEHEAEVDRAAHRRVARAVRMQLVAWPSR
jgi:hypothetical protein